MSIWIEQVIWFENEIDWFDHFLKSGEVFQIKNQTIIWWTDLIKKVISNQNRPWSVKVSNSFAGVIIGAIPSLPLCIPGARDADLPPTASSRPKLSPIFLAIAISAMRTNYLCLWWQGTRRSLCGRRANFFYDEKCDLSRSSEMERGDKNYAATNVVYSIQLRELWSEIAKWFTRDFEQN